MKQSMWCLSVRWWAALALAVAVPFFSARGATYTVVNTNDTGVGSLRWAILAIQSNPPPNEIQFNIPGPGPHTIKVVDILPFITNSVSVLGNTQPGYTGTPVVTVLGPTTNFLDYGVVISGPNVLVRGLRVSGFTQLDYGAGISIGGHPGQQVAGCVVDGNFNGIIAQGGLVGGTSTNDRNIIINNVNGIWTVTGSTAVIRGNFIGVEADGVTAAGNQNGIRTFYTSGLHIQGHPDYPQVISGNSNAGILFGPNGGYVWFSSANHVYGNHIGTDVSGLMAVPNGIGIHSWGGAGNRIGNGAASNRNVIAGNTSVGVLLEGFMLVTPSAFNNQVYGNYIGLGADGMTPLPNSVGVQVLNGRENLIGGSVPGRGNRFGVSDYYQVFINSTYSGQCYSNFVQGNWMGITTGNTLLAGGQTGIYILQSSNNLIGGVTSTARNVIGGAGNGISISGYSSQYNRVIGNLIGCGTNGERFTLSNYGVEINDAPRNQIGGVYSNEGNTISGTQYAGAAIRRTGSYHNVVSGNRIGTDATATFIVSNRYNGVALTEGAFSNVVGGTDFTGANVIAGNGSAGVSISDPATHANEVRYNYIGMSTAFVPLTNSGSGVVTSHASTNYIGPANYVGNNNGGAGIQITGTNGAGNVIFANVVGLDGAGNRRPNVNGIDVADARDTQVGLPVLFGGNVIGGSNSDGVRVRGLAWNTKVQGNYIGTDVSGTVATTNTGSGVNDSAYHTQIGGPGLGNLISGNALNGVTIGGGEGAVVQGNYIGVNVSGTGPLSNRQYGVYVNNATNVVIGGTGTARNVISASRLTGLVVDGASSNVLVVGNYIGLNATGTAPIPNGTAGVLVDAHDTTIGGTGELGNVVSGNLNFGIEVATGRQVRIIGNTVGLAADGVTPVPNSSGGLRLRGGARGVVVGGTNALEANVIARNGNTSEFVVEGPSAEHQIIGNFIGVQRYGVAFTNHDTSRGLFISESPSNRIAGNVLGQLGESIYLSGTGSIANVIQGNFIGEYQLEVRSNSSWGVVLSNAPNNRVGGFTTEERNLIAHNNGGIAVGGSNAVGNLLVPNLIFSNSARLAIDLGVAGFTPNDALDADLGPNRLQNRPVLTNQLVAGPYVYVQGVLTSAPLTTYALDLFRSGSTNADAYRYIGRAFFDTDGSGVGTFTAGFLFNPPAGAYVAATVTDPGQNTSELSASATGLVVTVVGDADNDGIADWWEALYGLNPAVSNAPDADFDIDGFTDLQEYLADTAANDDALFPVITWIAGETNRLVTFPSSSARVYSLQASDALDTGVWAQVGGSVTGQFGWTTLADTNQAAARQYRFAVRPAP